jgi:PAS domain S-box-containing protein
MKKTVTAVSSQTSPYLALFNNLPVFICIIDNHRRIVFLNKKSKRHYHAREGDYCYTSLVGRNKPCPGCTVERLSCDKVINQDWISPKGNLQLVMGTPFKKFGASRLSLKLGVDISKYKKTERQLDNYRQLNEDLINFLPDMTFAINTKGKVIAWNHAIEEYLGIKAKDIMGKGNEMYSYAFYRKRRPVLIDLVLRSKVELSKEYLLIKREHGALVAETFIPTLRGGVYLWGKASLIYDSQGTVIGAIESIRDITAQKSSENALRLSEERYRTIFESTVCHC